MAHFRSTMQGQRGETSRLGSKRTGLSVDVNGWTAGVSVRARFDETTGEDVFEIFATQGSGGGGGMKIGELRKGKEPVAFFPFAPFFEAFTTLEARGAAARPASEDEDVIAIKWCIEDVLETEPRLTKAEAREVLRRVEHGHDATLGVTWDTLQYHATDVISERKTEHVKKGA